MSLAQIGSQASYIAAQGYPKDGSKVLPRRLERLCTLLAAAEKTQAAIGVELRVNPRTIQRVAARPLVRARIAFLREKMIAAAYDATPLVDKRNRVVLAASLATTLHDEGQRKAWRDTVAVTKQGQEITGFDWRRTDQVRQLLDYIAKEVGDRTPTPAGSTTVNVGISMDDAVTRVQALLSRMPDVIAAESTPIAPIEGGGEG